MLQELHVCCTYLTLAWWCYMGTDMWVNIGSGNGLLSYGIKPLPEPMLTNHQRGLVAFTCGKFHKKCLKYLPFMRIWKLLYFDYNCIS